MKKITITLAFTLLGLVAHTQVGRLALSPTQKIVQKIALTEVTIEYSRPSMRDREIFGGLVPYDKYWRTGANRNTTIQFDQDVVINGERLRKGKYSIITKPSQNKWEILFYEEVDNWDVPDQIEEEKIKARLISKPYRLSKEIEVLEIEVGDFTNYNFDLNIKWAETGITFPIELTTKEMMDKKIKDHLEGPTYADYYLSAVYQMESGQEYKKGLKWIDQAIAKADETGWWDLRVKTILLMKLERYEEAKVTAKAGLASAKKEKREGIIKQFNKLLEELNK